MPPGIRSPTSFAPGLIDQRTWQRTQRPCIQFSKSMAWEDSVSAWKQDPDRSDDPVDVAECKAGLGHTPRASYVRLGSRKREVAGATTKKPGLATGPLRLN